METISVIPRRSTVLLLAALAFAGSACLGTLPGSDDAGAVALAPQDVLRLPLRENNPHWLLRQEPGWREAHWATFGGGYGDRALTTIRVALFEDAAHATAGFARLTPAHFYRLWQDRMTGEPRTVSFPVRLPGDQVAITEYTPSGSPEDGRGAPLLAVQLIVVRSGRTVIV
ncbi:MAG: hypothetical protein ACRDJE_03905, partial [Dehalococcoidia bacterium]